MGGQPSQPATPCQQGGDKLCAQVEHSLMCVSDGTNFQCACRSGFQSSGKNAASTCKDIDECATGKDECQTKLKNSMCENTEGSYTCVCGNYRTPSGSTCEDINECLQNRGGCGDFSNCINQDGAPVKCECWTGYTGNDGQPGIDCKALLIFQVVRVAKATRARRRVILAVMSEEGWVSVRCSAPDIDECTTANPCGSNAKCVNTPGSYRCECNSGYAQTSSNVCEPVNFCGTGQNTCDPYYAECIQTDGSYECQCKEYFTGSGKKGSCIPMTGHENLACELIGKKCTAYEECSPDTSGSYSCIQKGKMAQLAAFFTEGGSSDTPVWVWITVALGALLLILVIWWLIRRFLKKSDGGGAAAPLQSDPYGYGYGAMQYAY
ncbi:calcium binding egf domain-containing protein [Cystoisospora suis]|uniref:Calcium binding egf domain-containing protein n=1 Tax=Cystoisospora suis TaxID=483139 RepID=A0A2C6LET7_9APIC|nr:calcium binding egf domain-containing protein [Cystoisospora suis]